MISFTPENLAEMNREAEQKIRAAMREGSGTFKVPTPIAEIVIGTAAAIAVVVFLVLLFWPF